MWNRFKTFDPLLYCVPLVLSVISIVMIYSLTAESQGIGLALRQGIFTLIGLVIMLAATFIDYRSGKAWAWWLYGLGIAGILAVRIPGVGKSDFGAASWINLGFFQLQPSEVEKLIVCIVLAAFLATRMAQATWKKLALAVLLIAVPVLLVMAQPDLGTALVIAFSSLGMLFAVPLQKIQRWTIVGVLIGGIGIGMLSYYSVPPFANVLKPYQKKRIATFIDPSSDQSGAGYNINQSVIALGSGGLTGNGLGLGNQSRLNFLPVAHADFIFAVIGEAWGLVGTWGTIALYWILIWRTVQAARIAQDDFGMLLCIGIALKFLVEVTINIGMNIKMMPVTGIPLPFMSYGGTTMLVNMACVGMVQSVVIRYKRLTF